MICLLFNKQTKIFFGFVILLEWFLKCGTTTHEMRRWKAITVKISTVKTHFKDLNQTGYTNFKIDKRSCKLVFCLVVFSWIWILTKAHCRVWYFYCSSTKISTVTAFKSGQIWMHQTNTELQLYKTKYTWRCPLLATICVWLYTIYRN